MDNKAKGKFGVVVIGTSQGGFNALKKVLGPLPADLSVPILIVRHQSSGTDNYLLKALKRETQLTIKFADHDERPQPGTVYIAPPNRHLLLDVTGKLLLSQGEPINYSRPAIDPLFISAAAFFGPATLAVLLTGANDDGVKGLVEIKKHGGTIIIQDPDSADAPTMPRAAMAVIEADFLVWLDQIGPQIWTLLWSK